MSRFRGDAKASGFSPRTAMDSLKTSSARAHANSRWNFVVKARGQPTSNSRAKAKAGVFGKDSDGGFGSEPIPGGSGHPERRGKRHDSLWSYSKIGARGILAADADVLGRESGVRCRGV